MAVALYAEKTACFLAVTGQGDRACLQVQGAEPPGAVDGEEDAPQEAPKAQRMGAKGPRRPVGKL